MTLKARHTFFYFSVLALISVLYFPRIASYGLFMDGSIYGTISHNLALGDGDMWHPMYHNYYALEGVSGAVFYEHPPLVFWMQSYFFKVFGDGFYVENIYSTIILVLHILVITFFYRSITNHTQTTWRAWPVLLFWYMVPTISWSFPQNMLDNTMSLWSLLAVWAVFVSIKRDHFMWAVVAGLLIGLGFLTKGPMALFPLGAAFLYWLAKFWTVRDYSFLRAFYKTSALFFGFSMVALNVYMYPESHEFILQYFKQQVIPSVAGKREMANTIGAHLSIVVDMVVEYAVLYVPILALWVYARIFRKEKLPKMSTNALWLLLVGFSATLPIALSAKSHSFYLISGAPLMAMALVVYIQDLIQEVVDSLLITLRLRSFWEVGVALLFLVSMGMTTLKWGNQHRDEDVFMDLVSLAQKVPSRDTIGFSPDLSSRATLHSNLERHGLIYLNPDWQKQQVVIVGMAVDTLFLDSLSQNAFQEVAGAGHAFKIFEKSTKK